MAARLEQFAQVQDAVAATPRKLEKQALLAGYFRGLGEEDLKRAVRFAGGRTLPAGDERTAGVGGALITGVLLELLGVDAGQFHEQIIRSGEVGEALSVLWAGGAAGGEPLTLEELAAGFEALAATGRAEKKRAVLRELFGRCRIGREATYLAKILFADLRTGVQQGVLQAAVAGAFGVTLEQVLRGQLLLGNLERVAALARRGELHAAKFELFHPIAFMLASPVEDAAGAAAVIAERAKDGGFWVEDKLDGVRAQVHKSPAGVAVYTRTLDRAEGCFPEVAEAVRRLPGEFVLDGEVVPYAGGRVLPFAHIQRRLGRKKLGAAVLRENPVAFIAFDLLYRDGELLLDEPLRRRRQRLQELQGQGALLVSAARELRTAGEIAAEFEAARGRRNEGVMLKDPDSAYTPGRRGQAWLKLKTHLPPLDCVVTAAEYGHGKRRAVLSDYTFGVWDRDPQAEGARLVNIGKAYSGLTDAEIAQLTELFLRTSRGRYGRTHVVEPSVVLEITCDQVQKSGRHGGGYALRFPRIVRIRWDKAPADADRLERVAALYQSMGNFGRTEREAPPPERGLFD